MTDAPLDLDAFTAAGRAYAPDHAWNLMLAEIRRLRAEVDFQHKNRDNAVEIIRKLKEEIDRPAVPVIEWHSSSMAAMGKELAELAETNSLLRTGIARLTAPPGASAMERARDFVETWHLPERITNNPAAFIAQAEAAATAKEAQRCATIDCIDLSNLLAAARAHERVECLSLVADDTAQLQRDARAQAFEEAAQIADVRAKQLRARSDFDQWEAGGTTASGMIAEAIRALAAKPQP